MAASKKALPKVGQAKAKVKTREGQVEARIAHIANMMRELRWVRGKSGVELAKEWGLSEHRLRELSAEASKRVRTELTDIDAATVDICQSLQLVLAQGFADGDLKAVVAAAKVFAQVVGAMAPTRVSVKEEPIESLPDDKLDSLVREALATLKAKKK